MKNFSKNILLVIGILFAVAFVFSLIAETNQANVKNLSIDQVVKMINAGEIKNITVSGNNLQIVLNDNSKAVSQKESEAGLIETLHNYGVDSQALQKVEFKVQGESGFKYWLGIIIPTLLPLIIMVFIFWWIFRQAKTGVNQAFTFGKVNLRLFANPKDAVTFKDVAGLKEAKEDLEEVIDFLRHPKKFLEIGARIPRGVLLMGQPGTGKTLLARAVAGESNVPFFHISASEFVEMFVGVGASVTGDTPVLFKTSGGIKLLPIKEFVDQYYREKESGFVKPVNNVQTLGFQPLTSKFYGAKSVKKRFFGGSQWTNIQSVFRHKINEIYEIYYRGGLIRTTGDHSIFVRNGNMIEAKKASELKPGDILINLPFKVRSEFVPNFGTTHKIRAHQFPQTVNLELDLFDKRFYEEQRKYNFVLEQLPILSQVAIGKEIGVSQATVRNWQLGHHQPRFFSANVFTNNTPAKIKITPGLMKLLGYYTAEGRTTEYYTQFVFGLHEKDLHKDCIQLIKENFHLEPAVKDIPETNSLRITVSSPIVARFFEKYCGNSSHNKHLPAFIWELPQEYFLSYLDAYSRGDGYTSKEGKLIISSVSQQLIRELVWLCSMHGLQVGVGQNISPAGRIIKKKPLPETKYWRLTISKTSHPFREKMKLPYQWKKPIISKIIKKPYDDYVYDLCGCENEAFFGGEKPILLHNSRVRDLFANAKKAAPSIIFIDEIDAVGRERGAGLGGGHDEREQTLNQILVEMDGFERDNNVIVVAATNRPDILDSALLRPGRFDRRVILDMPDINDREEILKIHARGKPLDKTVSLRTVAVRTPGFSGADLANLVNEAAILTARQNRKVILQEDLFNSIEKVLLGPERKSRVISPKEKEIVAYHEAGHALMAAGLKDTDPIQKVSIISRGMAGGYTLKMPTEDSYFKTKTQFLNELAIAFGGYVSEQEVFKDVSTGAANDLRQTTELSRRLVTQYGMSEKLGPRTFGKTQELIFLGREISTEKDYSEKVAFLIDQEIAKFIGKALGVAKKIISEHRKILDTLAKTLIEKETLEQEEFYKIIKSFNLKPIAIK